MRALVTGATGFIGAALVERLCREDAQVAVVTRPGADPWRIQHLLPRLVRIETDLRHLAPAESAILDFAPDTVFHLAWQGVAGADRNDEHQIDANLGPTVDLARLARRAGCRTWIGLGSQAEYGPANRRLDEDAPASPTTTYGAVKLCTGLLVSRLLAESKTRFLWLRVFSTYGPRDHPDWLIPYLIRTLLGRQRPALTACAQTWDYLYIDDAADAICRAAASATAGGVYNVGSGRATALRAIVEQVRDLIDPALPLGIGEVPYRPDQVMHLEADVARLVRDTGWQPRTTLDAGLRATVDWYRGTLR